MSSSAESAPPLTVKGGIDGAIEKLFVAAEQLLQQAEARLKADTAAQRSTQAQIDSLTAGILRLVISFVVGATVYLAALALVGREHLRSLRRVWAHLRSSTLTAPPA